MTVYISMQHPAPPITLTLNDGWSQITARLTHLEDGLFGAGPPPSLPLPLLPPSSRLLLPVAPCYKKWITNKYLHTQPTTSHASPSPPPVTSAACGRCDPVVWESTPDRVVPPRDSTRSRARRRDRVQREEARRDRGWHCKTDFIKFGSNPLKSGSASSPSKSPAPSPCTSRAPAPPSRG